MNIKILLLLLILFNLQSIKAQNEYIDMSFGSNGGYTLYQLYVSDLSFTQIVDINGDFYTSGTRFSGDWYIAKFDSNGILDTTFGTNGRLDVFDNDGWSIDAANLSSLIETNDNKLFLVTGSYPSSYNPENFRTIVTKINLDGTIDASYGINGQYISELPEGINLIGTYITDTDEIIVVGYNSQNIIILKITNQGILDSTFGNNGIIELSYQYQTDTPVQAKYKNQSIYILYNNFGSGDAYIKKYNIETLNYDLNFGINGTLEINNSPEYENATAFMVDNNDIIYVSGSSFTGNNLEFDLFVYKYLNNILDSNFGNNGIVNFQLIPNTNSIAKPFSIKMEYDKLLIMGISYNWDSESYDKTFFTQLELDGSFDDNFGINGTIINYLFESVNISYSYLNYENSIITCGSCPDNTDPQIPCLVKYIKNPNLSVQNYKKPRINIFPNPTNRFLNLIAIDEIDEIEVYDYSGRYIKSYKVYQNKVDLNDLITGFYIIIAKSSDKQYNLKLIKK